MRKWSGGDKGPEVPPPLCCELRPSTSSRLILTNLNKKYTFGFRTSSSKGNDKTVTDEGFIKQNSISQVRSSSCKLFFDYVIRRSDATRPFVRNLLSNWAIEYLFYSRYCFRFDRFEIYVIRYLGSR